VSGLKRQPDVPHTVRLLGEHVSKADLLELVVRYATIEATDLSFGERPSEAEVLEELIFAVQDQRNVTRRPRLRTGELARIRGAADPGEGGRSS
jgi:hypothetical protein